MNTKHTPILVDRKEYLSNFPKLSQSNLDILTEAFKSSPVCIMCCTEAGWENNSVFALDGLRYANSELKHYAETGKCEGTNWMGIAIFVPLSVKAVSDPDYQNVSVYKSWIYAGKNDAEKSRHTVLMQTWPAGNCFAIVTKHDGDWQADSTQFFTEQIAFDAEFAIIKQRIKEDSFGEEEEGVAGFHRNEANYFQMIELFVDDEEENKALDEALSTGLNLNSEDERTAMPAGVVAGALARKEHRVNLVDIDGIMQQYSTGLISITEFLLAVQLSEHQVKAIIDYHSIPSAFAKKVNLAAIDEYAEELLNDNVPNLNPGVLKPVEKPKAKRKGNRTSYVDLDDFKKNFGFTDARGRLFAQKWEYAAFDSKGASWLFSGRPDLNNIAFADAESWGVEYVETDLCIQIASADDWKDSLVRRLAALR